MKLKMVKNKSKLAIKLFIIVWVVLAVHIALKLTFNYWQPYIIPNEQLQAISDFIDSHRLLKDTIDFIYCYINAIFVVLTGIQLWKFKNKIHYLILFALALMTIISQNSIIDTIITIFATIIYPLILDKKKWLYVILTFLFSNIFMALSLFLNGFTKTDCNGSIIDILFMNDYYIMLILNYFVFNFIRNDA